MNNSSNWSTTTINQWQDGHIINAVSGGCLDSAGDGSIGVNPCNDGDYQNWHLG
ncbi:hypothetical protein [Streptantibioticus ferralitis]|uniref:Ricin B lectin domain-containing protein n=1 Tax=Streptantibioticus ferralitis TaxID=236510 RepID=A0ABT5YU45_9ACTN|nr:hypothetical protein [Streptantibioticus ferralitis]MDF2255115.1 hypothetical protein [Streptantibioticus ferralitis]